MVGCFDNLRFGQSQIVNEKFGTICPSGMSEPLKVRLPIADVLIVDSVDHVLAQDVVRLVSIGLRGQEIRRDEVCLMNRGPVVTTTNGREHLVLQPGQISFQVAENQSGAEVPREWL